MLGSVAYCSAQKARELRRADPLGVVRSLLFGQHTDERAWRKGANGERFVGFVIGRLPLGWHVFHDIPVGARGANIDHVVVGPAGTFTLNAKNLTGKVWVGARSVRHNGHPTDFLPKATHEASRLSRLLSTAVGRRVDVRGVLAILADDWTIEERPTGVYVASPAPRREGLARAPAGGAVFAAGDRDRRRREQAVHLDRARLSASSSTTS